MLLLKDKWYDMLNKWLNMNNLNHAVDVCITYYIQKELGINPIFLEGFYGLNYDNYSTNTTKLNLNQPISNFKNISHHSFRLIKNPIVFHYIKPDMMYDLYIRAQNNFEPFN